MTDVELDARVTALEENGGANPQNGNSFLYTFIVPMIIACEVYISNLKI